MSPLYWITMSEADKVVLVVRPHCIHHYHHTEPMHAHIIFPRNWNWQPHNYCTRLPSNKSINFIHWIWNCLVIPQECRRHRLAIQFRHCTWRLARLSTNDRCIMPIHWWKYRVSSMNKWPWIVCGMEYTPYGSLERRQNGIHTIIIEHESTNSLAIMLIAH